MVNAKTLGELQTVVAAYSDEERSLALTFPDGRTVTDEVGLGDHVQTRFYSGSVAARLVEGPWSSLLSESMGKPLRLVEPVKGGATDRIGKGPASLISRASLARLASEADVDELDPRRFRMLIEIDGVGAHDEDRWVGRRARVGGALIAWGGNVGRCLITSRDPETGVIDVPTLDVLGAYRGSVATTEPLPFGIYGRVIEPGTVAVGDAVALEG
jgi:uncharacterized protein YcbX